MESRPATVVGAANVDIGGKPFEKLIPRDSNPGTVAISLGGVGRNIAHNLSLLQVPTRLVSAIGEDAHARHIVESCRELQIDIEDSYRTDAASTSTYLYIARDDGDMELAIADMRIIEYLTPEYLQEKEKVLSDSALLIVDANLPEETVHFLLKNATVPVFAETVSCTKAKKFCDVLSYIDTITPNALEAEVLTSLPIDVTNDRSIARAADRLLESGVKQVVITLGAQGAYYTDGTVAERMQPLKSTMVSGTGAGDALIAGVAAGRLSGYGFADSVKIGMASASITLESTATNNADLSFPAALARAGLA